MPFSHHSHSGQFCGHATNTLEEMIQTAIARRMTVFALTEHMPREQADLYSEEASPTPLPPPSSSPPRLLPAITPAKLTALFAAYHAEATRLRAKYAPHITILLGLEIDWIRPSSRDWVERLLHTYAFDLFVGSVHHVHAIPIDYDAPSYARARDRAGGTDERLFEAYFDAQFEMVCALRPPVVGHFDLVRLMSGDGEGSFRRWPGMWRAVERNLAYVAGYGGLLEVNSAGLRKGLGEPYPKAEICEAFLRRGGRFTLSDDCHGVEQVGTNYEGVLEFVEKAGIREVYFLERGGPAFDHRFPDVSLSSVGLADLKRHAFWRVGR